MKLNWLKFESCSSGAACAKARAVKGWGCGAGSVFGGWFLGQRPLSWDGPLLSRSKTSRLKLGAAPNMQMQNSLNAHLFIYFYTHISHKCWVNSKNWLSSTEHLRQLQQGLPVDVQTTQYWLAACFVFVFKKKCKFLRESFPFSENRKLLSHVSS